jgi:hypothetical protein
MEIILTLGNYNNNLLFPSFWKIEEKNIYFTWDNIHRDMSDILCVKYETYNKITN